jgi:hypothetical protein
MIPPHRRPAFHPPVISGLYGRRPSAASLHSSPDNFTLWPLRTYHLTVSKICHCSPLAEAFNCTPAFGAAACEFRQLRESAAKLACEMLGRFKVNASALRSGAGVAIVLAIFQTALAINAMRLFEKGDRSK